MLILATTRNNKTKEFVKYLNITINWTLPLQTPILLFNPTVTALRPMLNIFEKGTEL